MIMKPFLLTILLSGTIGGFAQNRIGADITTEGAVGNGDFTPYHLTSNRHGILSNEKNTGYLRASVDGQHLLKHNWTLEEGIDLQIQKDDYNKFFLQQLYVSASWKWLTMYVGSREENPVLRNFALSSGSLISSGNARPIPQAKLGTNGFITIPGTRHWVQVYIDASYGYFMDDDYIQDRYDEYNPGRTLTGSAQSFLTTGTWYHQKKVYFRSNPDKRWVVTAGIEHAVQFGGKTENHIDNTINGTIENKVKLKDFFKVLWPSSGDDESAAGDQQFVYGNHLGEINLMLSYKVNAENEISIYVENPFEDGSGMAKRNGWDGLWGIEWKTGNVPFLSGIVFEHLRTCDQSGPIHWAPADHANQSWLQDQQGEARGSDDYYNNYFYTGYHHFGQALGSPMLKSPAYNKDSYLRFTDTRVQACHLGLHGNLSDRWSYRLLASYRDSWGTPYIPANQLHHSFDAMLELHYQWRDWTFTAAAATDRGNLYGDNTAVNLRIKRHFNLLTR